MVSIPLREDILSNLDDVRPYLTTYDAVSIPLREDILSNKIVDINKK